MTKENIEKSINKLLNDIAEIKTKQKIDNTKIEETMTIATQIHRLVANVENLTDHLKEQNKRIDRLVDTWYIRIKEQDDKIGNLEIKTVIMDGLLKRTERLEEKIEHHETKGSRQWEGMIERIIIVIITAIVVYSLGSFGL